jgi:hypothetical protein
MGDFLAGGAGCACAPDAAGNASRASTLASRFICDRSEMPTQFLRDKEDTAWSRRRQLLGSVLGGIERRKEHERM